MLKSYLSPEIKKQAIIDLKEYFLNKRGEEIGDLAADIILDFISEKIGPHFYNQAIYDVSKYMSDKIDDLNGFIK